MNYKLYTLDNEFIITCSLPPDHFTGIVKYYNNGDVEYYLKNGEYHREDGPAFISKTKKHWYINGQRHRVVGPAIEIVDGNKQWFIDGKEITEQAHKLLYDIMKLKGLL